MYFTTSNRYTNFQKIFGISGTKQNITSATLMELPNLSNGCKILNFSPRFALSILTGMTPCYLGLLSILQEFIYQFSVSISLFSLCILFTQRADTTNSHICIGSGFKIFNAKKGGKTNMGD